MAEISSHTRGVHQIVQRQVADQIVLLQQQRQRLANTSSGTQYGYLSVLQQRRTRHIQPLQKYCLGVQPNITTKSQNTP